MPLDLIQFLADLLRGHERIVEMALLEFVVAGEESGIVIEGFDCKEDGQCSNMDK